MTGSARHRHTKRGKKAVMDRLYRSRKWARDVGKSSDEGLHGKRLDRRRMDGNDLDDRSNLR